ISAICGGYRGWLIDPDAEMRRSAYEDLARLLELAGTLGCGCVVVPIWGRTRNLPGIATGRTRDEDEAIFVDAVSRLGRTAERFGSRLAGLPGAPAAALPASGVYVRERLRASGIE